MLLPRRANKVKKALKKLAKGFQEKAERYKKLYLLGEGGFGEVDRCFDQHLNRVVARKVLNSPQGPVVLEDVSLMLNEARILSYLEHPGIAPIYDLFVSGDGELSYTMKLIEGNTLQKVLSDYKESKESIPLSYGLQIFTKLCETMAYVHEKGIIHLDIKPANIIIGRFGEAILVDWGTAKLYDASRYHEFLEREGVDLEGNEIYDHIEDVVGTPLYMPLEQMTRPRDALLPSTDIFSAGVLLYYMLSGYNPYPGSDLREYATALSSTEPPELMDLRSDIPPQLSFICSRMLKKDPEDRYQSFLEVTRDLQEMINSGNRFRRQFYEKGDVIFREGEVGDYALRIIDGEVEISVLVDGQPKVLTTRTRGEVIGELAIFSEESRSATVTALKPTLTQIMTREAIETELDKLPPWSSQIIKGLSNKFREQQDQFIAEKKS